MAIVQAAMLAGCDRAGEPGAATNTAAPVSAAAPTAAIGPAAAATPLAGPERLILAFGDSLYAGYGLRRGQSLPDALEAGLRRQGIRATFVNAGVSGDTTAGGRRRLAYTLDRLERAPDLVLLGLGGNDVLRQVDAAETRRNLTAMLTELERREIPVVLTGMLAPPNLGPDFATRFNAIWPALAERYDARLYPFILDGVIGNRTLMLPDGVHPNARGVAAIAERLTPVVAARVRELPVSGPR